MTQHQIENETREGVNVPPLEQDRFHYFASHAMGWATADSEEAVIEKLLLENTDPTWARNCLKDGTPLVFFVCRVPLPSDAPYRIEWFIPKVDGITEGKNMLVTYLTKTKYAVMRDPADEIRQLKAKLDNYSTVTLSKGGTAEREIKAGELQIADLWHIAEYLDEHDLKFGSGMKAGDAVRDVWQLAHDLKKHILEVA